MLTIVYFGCSDVWPLGIISPASCLFPMCVCYFPCVYLPFDAIVQNSDSERMKASLVAGATYLNLVCVPGREVMRHDVRYVLLTLTELLELYCK